MKRFACLFTLLITLILSTTVTFAQDELVEDQAVTTNPVTISYKSHSANLGWADHYYKDGETAGTTGLGLQLECLEVKTENLPRDTILKMSAHVAEIGWMSDVYNQGQLGTTGLGLGMQAVKFEVISGGGSIQPRYDIYYRTHVANIGWMGWAKNGEIAGTCGQGLPIEAIEIRIVPSGSAAPGDTSYHGITEEDAQNMDLSYRVELLGLDPATGVDGSTCGTNDQNSSLQLLSAQLTNPVLPAELYYQAAANAIGWTGWQPAGGNAGSFGNQIETIQFELHGPLSAIYDIYYRANIRGYGWMDWAKNGEFAGTMFGDKAILAVEAQLVRKNQPAPGYTYRSFLAIPNGEAFQGRGIYVSIPRQLVFLQDENSRITNMWDCTTGTPNTSAATPIGNFSILKKSRHTYLYGSDYVQYVDYWIPFIGQEYGFHDANGVDPWREDWEFGRDVYLNNGSHGCVNMRLNDVAEFNQLIRIGDPVIIR